MTNILILTLALLLTPFAAAADKAPSKEKCDGDVKAGLVDKTMDGLGDLAEEMSLCSSAYSTLDDRYFLRLVEVQTEVIKRQKDFLRRHGFSDAFLKEDAAGER